MKWVLRIVGGLAAVLVLGAITLMVMGHRANANHIHSVAELSGTPADIWPWINDADKVGKWVSWVVEVRNPSTYSVGAKRVVVMKDENNGGQVMEIAGTFSEYQPPSRMTVQLTSAGGFDGTQAYRLTDLGDGHTRLEIDFDFHFTSAFARLMEPLITPQAEKKMVSDLDRLKSLVGQKAAI